MLFSHLNDTFPGLLEFWSSLTNVEWRGWVKFNCLKKAFYSQLNTHTTFTWGRLTERVSTCWQLMKSLTLAPLTISPSLFQEYIIMSFSKFKLLTAINWVESDCSGDYKCWFVEVKSISESSHEFCPVVLAAIWSAAQLIKIFAQWFILQPRKLMWN